VTSERKIKANRANARASTGPKTAHGRSHAARNAVRHALSLPVYADPVWSEEVESLTRQIIGTDADPEKQQHLSRALSDPDYESEATLRKKAGLIIGCFRRIGPSAPMPDNVMEFLQSKPEGPCKFATILADKTRQLLALDRYERRALSRRKFAIREFDIGTP